jgi:hypothetical protein
MGERLLSVSYDVSFLTTRRMLLEQRGYEVTSALGFNAALECCRVGEFDLFISGPLNSSSGEGAADSCVPGKLRCAYSVASTERLGAGTVRF